MARTRTIAHHGEGIVLRTWLFQEADLLVSLFTREQGVVKGVARHAMRSRRRFGGALEPGTHVVAHYAERPKEDLVRLDTFEIVWSPLKTPMKWLQVAGLQLVVEVLEQALPELAPEDNVFRLALTVLFNLGGEAGSRKQEVGNRGEHLASSKQELGIGCGETGRQEDRGKGDRGQEPEGGSGGVWLAVTYFCVWMCRLMGWWPELGHCAVCGLDLRGETVWWSPVGDGVTCYDDRRRDSRGLSAESVLESYVIARSSLADLMKAGAWPKQRAADLRDFATALLERHLERRLRSAAVLR